MATSNAARLDTIAIRHPGAGPQNINSGHGEQFNNTISGGFGNTQYINQSFRIRSGPSPEELDLEFRKRLFVTDPTIDRNNLLDTKEDRVPNTCEWILTAKEYTTWLRDGTSQLLWICGGPGKGKTVLSIFISQELETTAKTTYFFCSAEDKERNTAISVLRGLLWQMTGIYPKLLRILHGKLQTASQAALASRETLWAAFIGLIRAIQPERCYCVIDGLDECDENSQQWLAKRLIALGNDDHTSHFKVLIVSRYILHLRHTHQLKLDSDYSASINAAVKTFIRVKTETLFAQVDFNDDKLRGEIRHKLSEGAQGSFLWVGFAMIDVLKQKTPTAVMRVLRDLPAGLYPLYDRMLQNIDETQRQIGVCILCCAAIACRPLTLDELVSVLRYWPQMGLSVGKEVIEDLITECGPLFQTTKPTVTLVHESVRDYAKHCVLADGPRLVSEETHLRFARACIDALAEEDQKSKVLTPYASEFWPHHARLSGAAAKELIVRSGSFFSASSTSRVRWWQSYLNHQPPSVSKHNHISPLDMACLLGIEPWANDILTKLNTWPLIMSPIMLLIRILKRYVPTKLQNAQATTALRFAAIGGRDEIARLLLTHGAAINAEDCDGHTALQLAATEGQEATVSLLLDHDADIETRDETGMTALHLAAMLGHEATVKVLLDRGANIKSQDQYGETPLHWAARAGGEAALKLLLERGANVNATTYPSHKSCTALHYAACGGYETLKIAKILLKHGADVNARDNTGRTALHLAASSWNQALKTLETMGETRFHRRATIGFVVVTRLSVRAIMNRLKAKSQLTATTITSFGNEAIVKLLIEHRADIDIEDENGETALKISRAHSSINPLTRIRSWADTDLVDMSSLDRAVVESWVKECRTIQHMLEKRARQRDVDS